MRVVIELRFTPEDIGSSGEPTPTELLEIVRESFQNQDLPWGVFAVLSVETEGGHIALNEDTGEYEEVKG